MGHRLCERKHDQETRVAIPSERLEPLHRLARDPAEQLRPAT